MLLSAVVVSLLAVSLTSGTAYAFDFYKVFSDLFGTSQKITGFAISATYCTPTITTTSLSDGTVNSAYSYQLAATGPDYDSYGSQCKPYYWYVSSGSLPAGLKLSTTGAITGTPTTSDTYTFTIGVFDQGIQQSSTKQFTMNVAASADTTPPLISSLISSTTSSSATITWATNENSDTCVQYWAASASYSSAVTQCNTAQTSVTSHSVTISGLTPSTSYTYIAKSKDAAGNTGSSTNGFTTQATATCTPTITTSSLPSGTVGTAYSQQLAATGPDYDSYGNQCKPYYWYVSSGSLPAGLKLSTTGAITGTPTTSGTYTFTIGVYDYNIQWGTSKSFTMNVVATSSGGSGGGGSSADTTPPASSISSISGSTASGTASDNVGVAKVELAIYDYNNGLRYNGSSGQWQLWYGGSYIWFPATGTTSWSYNFGTALTNGHQYELVSRATDTSGNVETPSSVRVFTYSTTTCSLTITTSSLPSGTVNAPYYTTLNASAPGCTGPYVWYLNYGQLPPGVQLFSSGETLGRLNGTPTAAGNYTFSLALATSDYGQITTKVFTIMVNPATTTCTDSDGGLNYYVKGTISGYLLFHSDYNYYEHSDSCSTSQDGNPLNEYYCDSSSAASTSYNCPYGCSNGACLQQPTNATTASVSITTDKLTYGLNESVQITVRIKSDSATLSNIVLNSIVINRPDGATDTIAPSGLSGTACAIDTNICTKTYSATYYKTNLAGSYSASPKISGLPPNTDISAVIFNVGGISGNLPPVIDGVGGPTSLNVSQVGTWTVKAHDPDGTYLSYSVDWGDTTLKSTASKTATTQSATQDATFQHSYANSGRYTITFTVTDSSGASTKSTMTVDVGTVGGSGLGLYPQPFSNNNGANTIIVIGSNAVPFDYIGAIDIAARLTADAIPGYISQITYPKFVVKADREVTTADKSNNNLILIGGPASNTLVAELAAAGKTWTLQQWLDGTKTNTAIIQLVDNAFSSGKSALIVAGYASLDTRVASSILQNWDSHRSEFNGKYLVVYKNGVPI